MLTEIYRTYFIWRQ